MVIGSSWVQLKRVNPRPSPTHSARQSESAKAKVVLNCCNSVLERNRVDSGEPQWLHVLLPKLEVVVQKTLGCFALIGQPTEIGENLVDHL
ncbi:hypothetical protein H5410_046202 [Solanum commersonii]|uniref:Uncharacterized protein n=1 Tax=Solanum commersonii TaxID=4109 RepID=A0A9J5XFV4_SOLCO|nr:hypothetical protein H5410_046202 [Solanum commersonii]